MLPYLALWLRLIFQLPAIVLNSTTTDVYIVNKHDSTYTMMVVYQLMKSVQLPSS